ncbi:MAG TPA: hypothetical protein VHC95_01340 [Opitutales bacterium]|nr:hypothetical protein [Opitutales bacterium]
MKEISLQDLLNMADPAAHDGIGDLWNQKAIHYLVVFTSQDEDFELIGAGPTLPYATIEQATAHSIAGKKPEFYVKCPGALAVRLQPKLAPTQLGLPKSTQSAATPSLRGRTSAPFSRPAAKAPEKGPTVDASSDESAAKPEMTPAEMLERERAIKQREVELATLSESLKAREALLKDREAVIAAIEERLLNPTRPSG